MPEAKRQNNEMREEEKEVDMAKNVKGVNRSFIRATFRDKHICLIVYGFSCPE